MRVRGTTALALAALLAGLVGAGSAHAGFVPALGSPFPYAAPTKAMAVLDADRNGTLDVVAGGLTLRRGAGTGFLGGPLTVGTPGAVEGLAAADLDGDGLTDFAAIAPGAQRRLLRYAADGGGGYSEQMLLADAGTATDVAVAELNGDGLTDYAVVRAETDPNVTVVYGGALTEDEFESGVESPRDVEVGDVTGDGLPDLVVAGTEPSVAVLANQGGGSFTPGDPTPTGGSGASRRIALTHVDGDGRPDLLATDSGAATVLVLLGNGAGGFQPLGGRPTGLAGATTALAVGDVNGDGVLDAVAGAAGAFAVMLGDGSGGFASLGATASGAPGGGAVEALAAADMNRDGQLDVVAANRNGSVSVQLNDETGLLSASPTGIDFGTLLPASGTRTATVTLRAARGQLRVTRLDRKGSRLFDVRDGDCLGRTLLLGQSCSVSVSFAAPRRARRHEALLSFDANAPAVVLPLTATTRPPIVDRLRLKRRRVKPGQRLALRYRLSEGAIVRVITERARAGRRVGPRGRRRCVAPRRGNLRRRRCTRWKRVARTARRELAGRQRMKVATRAKPTGRGRRRRPGAAYAPGAYRLTVSAMDRFRNRSEEQPVRFRIVEPVKRRAR